MDKGIRAFARNYFVEMNELRRHNREPFNGPRANRDFRRAVMDRLMEEFGCTLAAAAAHYNDALINLKNLNAELVSGLGRPEDKKGGRKSNAERARLAAEAASVAVQPEFIDAEFVDQTEYTVKCKKTNEVLATFGSLEEARDLVRQGRWANRFRKMYWI